MLSERPIRCDKGLCEHRGTAPYCYLWSYKQCAKYNYLIRPANPDGHGQLEHIFDGEPTQQEIQDKLRKMREDENP